MSETLQNSSEPALPGGLFSIDDLPELLTTSEDKNLAGGVIKKIKVYAQTVLLGAGLYEQTRQITAALETFKKLTAIVMLSPNDFAVLCSDEPDDYCLLDEPNDANSPLQYFWIPVEDALKHSSKMSSLNDRFHH